MARKHRRHYRGLTTLSFGSLPGIPSSVSTKGLGIGAGLGLAAGLGARYAWNTYAPAAWVTSAAVEGSLLKFVHDHLPGLASIAAGVVGFYVQKKRGKGLGGDILVGAGLTGAALVILPLAQATLGTKFQGLTTLNFGGMRGIYMPTVEAKQLRGLYMPTAPQRQTSMGPFSSGVAGYVAARTQQNTAQLAGLSAARMRRY